MKIVRLLKIKTSQKKKTIEKLLNEIFSTNNEENERKIEDFIDEKQIKMGQ